MHISIIRGDFIFHQWEDEDFKAFHRKENELRKQGFRKVNQDYDYLNMYVTYKRKKKRITLTMAMC